MLTVRDDNGLLTQNGCYFYTALLSLSLSLSLSRVRGVSPITFADPGMANATQVLVAMRVGYARWLAGWLAPPLIVTHTALAEFFLLVPGAPPGVPAVGFCPG
jgi:hypothetical protein